MTEVGEGEGNLYFVAVFAVGVVVGTVVRFGVRIAPDTVVDALKRRFMPDDADH